jgi:hypothetical protein
MPEMILPGTYVEVRAEGLISAGRVSTGNIGIVGTATKGTVDNVYLISSLAEAKAIFGESDEWINGNNNELTLIRALDLIYKNGGRTIYVVRTAKDKVFAKASYELKQGTAALLALEAASPGTWGNDIKIAVSSLKSETSVPAKVKVFLSYGSVEESYETKDVADLAQQINARSTLVTAAPPTTPDQKKPPDEVATTAFTKGNDGAEATAEDYTRSLTLLENEDVNIVVLAGQGMTSTGKAMATLLEGHLKTTAQIKRERIGIIGSGFEPKDELDKIAAHTLNNDRLIFTAPGVVVTANGKESRLPGSYLAAALAGLISSLPVQASPTNKSLAIEGVTTTFNSSQLEKLTQSRVCAVEKRNGFSIVKGITTDNESWKQITTRRIVDYAIYGVRSGCDPYIGKLNNERVRGAMKATLDGFLTRMVENEALVSYQLEVSATRAQEVAGEAMVTMTLMPTFSIDFIKVTMYLS